MIIAVGNDGQFAALCKVLDHEEWAQDERFSTNTRRVANRETVIGLLSEETARKTTAEWVKACEGVGVPCGPINDLKAVFSDPHVVARGLQIELPHNAAGKVPLVGSPIRMSETPVEYRLAPPQLGEHTTSVLAQLLGLTVSEIAALADNGITQSKGAP